MSAAVFDERIDPGRAASAALSLVVHLLLLAVLIFGVSWQNRPAQTITAELWEAPTALPPKAVPPPEPPKPAPRVEEPPPPKPAPKIEKPDIVEKAPPKVVKPVPKPEPKPAPLKPRVDESKRRMEQELAREQASLAVDQERARVRDQLNREASDLKAKAMADWMAKVRAKIRGNMVLPDVSGNPEALFDVVQLPNGEVLSVKLKKSSGNPALDAAIERAILKSSPLPKPDKESPPRAFVLKYNPLDPL